MDDLDYGDKTRSEEARDSMFVVLYLWVAALIVIGAFVIILAVV